MTDRTSPLSEPQFRDTGGVPKRSWYSLSSSPSAGRLSLPESPSVLAGFPFPPGPDFFIDEPAFAAAKSGVFGPDGRTLPGLDHPIWTVGGHWLLRGSHSVVEGPAGKPSRQRSHGRAALALFQSVAFVFLVSQCSRKSGE